MAAHCYRQKRVKVSVPLCDHRYYVQNLNKGDKVSFPPGCTPLKEPELLPEDLFQRVEYMPINLKKPPFALTVVHPKQESIQKILQFSLKQQKEQDVSYCPGFVCYLIKSCLEAIGVDCKLQLGYRKFEKDSNPHMWLLVEGDEEYAIVDNTYEKYMTKNQIASLEKSIPDCYINDLFDFPDGDKMPTDKDKFSEICYKKNMEIFFTEPSKGLALGLNQEQLYVYFFEMIHFMRETFDVGIPGIDPNVRHFCWCCEVYPSYARELLSDILPDHDINVEEESRNPFKRCSLCMVANYCSPKCQENDWDSSHRLLCVSRGTGPSSDY